MKRDRLTATIQPTHSPGRGELRAINLFALPCGGFEVRDAFYGRNGSDDRILRDNGDFHHNTAIAAFSTLAEALEWLRVSMAHPAITKETPAER